MWYQDHSFLERNKGQTKQHFLKSLPDCRNRIAASNEQQDKCVKSHITDASLSSMGPAWTAKEWGVGEEIQGCCHSFYADHTFAGQVLEKARPPGHQQQPDIGPGQQMSCTSIPPTWMHDQVEEKAGSSDQLENYHEQKPKHYHKNMKTQGEKKLYEDTVIGYLYVNDSSRSPRLSHSVNCLAVHLAANSWLNLNILWLKWMHQRLRHHKVTRFSLSSTSRCTNIPLMLTLTYILWVCVWYISDFQRP